MREFTKVSPALHNSDKFRALGRDYAAKCVYQYLLSCPHGNSSGCFDLKPGYACEDLDMDLNDYRNHIDTLCKVGLIEVEAGKNTVFVVNWLEFNGPANPKHAIGMLTQLDKASSETLFCKRFNELLSTIKQKKFDKEQSVRASLENLSIRFSNGIATRPDQTKETGDQTEDQTRPKPNPDLREEAQTALRPAPLGRSLGPVEEEPHDDGGGAIHHLLQTDLMRRTA